MQKRRSKKPASPRPFTLTGHSGCGLAVEKQKGRYVVIKTSKNAPYNARLQRQHEKQKKFDSKIFRTPQVLASWHENGLFTFSMEYVHGFTLAEYLKRASPADIQAIAEMLMRMVPKNHVRDRKAPAAFTSKHRELAENIKGQSKEVKRALVHLEKYPWTHTAKSYCHGDLTLENIIWKDGELYLIDFLDSFYDSWMIDFGKLFFDLECLWSYRYEKQVDENLKTRLSILKNILLDRLLALPRGRTLVREIYHMALLHNLRILPYVQDDYTAEYLKKSIATLHNRIDSL
jgi:thiamine kinase-like enzyme